ncbi:MAG: DNA polymerase I, partial [Endomicrobia bacterium]|nr:DNA polymerase I [Endomicrobiia bacterium]
LDVFSLMGDASDNVPGVKGIGEKTAVKLIKEFGSLEKTLDNASSVKGNTGKLLEQGRQDALKSKELIRLKDDVAINYSLESFKNVDIPVDKAIPFFEKYEFKSLIDKYSGAAFEEKQSQMHHRRHPELTRFVASSSKSVIGDPGSAVLGFNGEMPKQVRHDTSPKHSIEVREFKSAVIDTKEKMAAVAAAIEKSGKVAVKTLGSSPDSLKSNVVGVSLCTEGESYYIPIGHNELTQAQVSFDDFKDAFAQILANEKIKKIGHDLKTERNIYRSLGMDICGLYFDVMLASYCLDPSKPHDITYMAKEYMDFEAGDESFLGKASKRISFADAPSQECAKYANSAAFAAYSVYEKFEIEIKENGLEKLFYEIEMPLLEVLSGMELAGIKVDTEFLRSFGAKITAEMKTVEIKIYAQADKEFNINSPKQLASVMFEKLNLPAVKKTKTGYSTDEEVLTELSASYEFPAEILKYRELQKLKSTYIDPISSYCAYYGDRIHTIFNQAVTTTGRLSSTDPNLQNIPIKSAHGREFRKAFVPEKEHIYVSADYSQIDLRVLAHISGDEKLIEAFKAGEDIHASTAREVFGVEKGKSVPDELRSAAKAINFGIVYGISPFGLSRQLNIQLGQAKEYIDGYLAKYAGVKKWMHKIVEDAKKDGFVQTLTGRIRYIPELSAPNAQARAGGERMALNTPVQGSSADIIKMAMINIGSELNEKDYGATMILQVHDDLLFEVSADKADNLSEMIKDKMENALKLEVPLIVDVKQGKNWGEMKRQ